MIGEIIASRMTEGRWMFVRLRKPRRPHGGTPCDIIGVREYPAYDVVQIVDWLADRAAGYPRKWPALEFWPIMDYCPACEGGTGPHRPDTWNH